MRSHKLGLRGVSALFIGMWLLGCGGAEKGDSEWNMPWTNGGGGAPGYVSSHPQALIGTWLGSNGGTYGEYAEQFEFRADGTASRVRKTPGWANIDDAHSWISVYECDWSVSGPKAPSRVDPWTLEQACEEISHTEPTEAPAWSRDYTGLGSAAFSTMYIPAIARSAVTIKNHQLTELEYRRVAQP